METGRERTIGRLRVKERGRNGRSDEEVTEETQQRRAESVKRRALGRKRLSNCRRVSAGALQHLSGSASYEITARATCPGQRCGRPDSDSAAGQRFSGRTLSSRQNGPEAYNKMIPPPLPKCLRTPGWIYACVCVCLSHGGVCECVCASARVLLYVCGRMCV